MWAKILVNWKEPDPDWESYDSKKAAGIITVRRKNFPIGIVAREVGARRYCGSGTLPRQLRMVRLVTIVHCRRGPGFVYEAKGTWTSKKLNLKNLKCLKRRLCSFWQDSRLRAFSGYSLFPNNGVGTWCEWSSIINNSIRIQPMALHLILISWKNK